MIWRLPPMGVGLWIEIFSAEPLGLAVAAGLAVDDDLAVDAGLAVDDDLAVAGDLVGLAFCLSVLAPARHQPG